MQKSLALQGFNKVSLLMRSCGELYLYLPSAKHDEHTCSRYGLNSLEPTVWKQRSLNYVVVNRLRHQTANVLDDLLSVGTFGYDVGICEIGD